MLPFYSISNLEYSSECIKYVKSPIFLFVSSIGGARLATCPRKQVFNNATGNCGDPKEVPGW
jgi:hypothetical protein